MRMTWRFATQAGRAAAPDLPGLAKIHARIGIATGYALVGNVGSHDRFNSR
jgi:class 3 adenylate cyclase